MPFRNILLLVFLVFLLLITPSFVSAAGFQLTHIGSLDVTGTSSSQWWYTTANPTLTGTTSASTSVDVTIDSTPQTVTADSSGNWTFASTALAAGDHTVSLVSNGSTIAFTLHIGAVPTGIAAPQTNSVPVAGSTLPTALLLLGGLGVILSGAILLKLVLHHAQTLH